MFLPVMNYVHWKEAGGWAGVYMVAAVGRAGWPPCMQRSFVVCQWDSWFCDD